MAPLLLVIGTHPIQYHAPVYRTLESHFGVRVKTIYGSDFSVAGYFDKDFHSQVAWDVDLATTPDRCRFLSRVADGGAKSVEEVTARGLARMLRQWPGDAILLTGYYSRFHTHAFLAASRLRVPLLLRYEAVDFSPTPDFRRWLRNAFLTRLYARCSRLLPIGKGSYAHYRRLGCPPSKLVLSPYCVDTAPFQCDEASRPLLRAAARSQFGISPDRLVVLVSGKMIAHKRPLLLLEAIRLLPEPVRGRIALLFLGDGPERTAVQHMAALQPAIPFFCTGFKGQTELSPYYHASDLLVLASKSETWGLVVNEALHHGVPCVVTDTVGCAPDLIQPSITGEIAQGSAHSLAQAMTRALALVGSPTVRDRCRSQVSGYTVELAAAGLQRAVYESLGTSTASVAVAS